MSFWCLESAWRRSDQTIGPAMPSVVEALGVLELHDGALRYDVRRARATRARSASSGAPTAMQNVPTCGTAS